MEPLTVPPRSIDLLKRRANTHPPFQHIQSRGLTWAPYKVLLRNSVQQATLLEFLSAPSPYSRKPGLFGPNVSICAKGVSRGVHNIAFLLSPDDFRANDLFFFCPRRALGVLVTCKQLKHHSETSKGDDKRIDDNLRDRH
jgi:hypothetical protein